MGAYSYNGVVLPMLPELDESVYPYVALGAPTNLSSTNTFVLYGAKSPFVATAKDWGTRVYSTEVCFMAQYSPTRDTTWRDIKYYDAQETQFSIYNGCVWSNHDILNEDGSVYLAASTPIPVGSIPEQTFLGMLLAQFGVLPHVMGKIAWNGAYAVEEVEITDSWETIIESVNNGTYKSRYKLGNYKPLDLGSEGVVNMQIVDFDRDNLADGSGKAAITWIAIELLKTSKSADDASYTTGGWEYWDIRSYLNTTIRALVPEPVSSAIKPITINRAYRNSAGTWIYTDVTDEIWVPLATGFVNTLSIYDNGYAYAYSLKLWELGNRRYNMIKYKSGETEPSSWLDGFPYGVDDANMHNYTGTENVTNLTTELGICIIFCT